MTNAAPHQDGDVASQARAVSTTPVYSNYVTGCDWVWFYEDGVAVGDTDPVGVVVGVTVGVTF